MYSPCHNLPTGRHSEPLSGAFHVFHTYPEINEHGRELICNLFRVLLASLTVQVAIDRPTLPAGMAHQHIRTLQVHAQQHVRQCMPFWFILPFIVIGTSRCYQLAEVL